MLDIKVSNKNEKKKFALQNKSVDLLTTKTEMKTKLG
jgi:hypothetical protein